MWVLQGGEANGTQLNWGNNTARRLVAHNSLTSDWVAHQRHHFRYPQRTSPFHGGKKKLYVRKVQDYRKWCKRENFIEITTKCTTMWTVGGEEIMKGCRLYTSKNINTHLSIECFRYRGLRMFFNSQNFHHKEPTEFIFMREHCITQISIRIPHDNGCPFSWSTSKNIETSINLYGKKLC